MKLKPLFIGIVCCLPITAMAQNWDLNGVITQGAFYTSDNNIYGPSDDDISFQFTEASLNGSYNLPYNLRLASGVNYRHAGAGFDGLNLDYLLLDYQFFNGENYSGGIMGGKVKSTIGLYNDTRDIAFTRPSIYISQGIYLDTQARNTITSGPGVVPYFDYFTENGTWSFLATYGTLNDEDLNSYNPVQSDGTVFSVGYGNGLEVQYASADERFIASYFVNYIDSFVATTPVDFDGPGPTEPINLETKVHNTFNIVSIQYTIAQWTMISEYSASRNKSRGTTATGDPAVVGSLGPEFYASLPVIDTETRAFYLKLQRRLNENWTVYIGHDVHYTNADDKNGETFAAGGGQAHSQFAKDSGIGFRWTPKPEVLVSAEYHYVDGTSWLNRYDNPGYEQDSARYWNILALTASYRF